MLCQPTSYRPAGDWLGRTDVAGATAHRFLYFPSENHWVLNPQHTKIWYQVVRGFLDRHLLGRDVEESKVVPRAE